MSIIAKGLILLHRQALYAPTGQIYVGDKDWASATAWTEGAYLEGVARTSAGFSAVTRREGMVAVDILDGYPDWIDDQDLVENLLGRRLFSGQLYFDSGAITVCAPSADKPYSVLVPPRKGPFEVSAFSYPLVNARRVALIFESYSDKAVPTDGWMHS